MINLNGIEFRPAKESKLQGVSLIDFCSAHALVPSRVLLSKENSYPMIIFTRVADQSTLPVLLSVELGKQVSAGDKPNQSWQVYKLENSGLLKIGRPGMTSTDAEWA